MASNGFYLSLSRARWIQTLCLFFCLVLCVYLFYNYYQFQMADGENGESVSTGGEATVHNCPWSPDDPLLYIIRTHLQVNYDAGHWFHMSENILTYHSILRAANKFPQSSTIYFLFDTPHFPEKLNAMTRMITFLGIANASSSIETVRYFSNQQVVDFVKRKHVKLGETFMYRPDPEALHSTANDQWISLLPAVRSEERFQELVRPSYLMPTPDWGVCLRYMGEVGGQWPTVQRGHWFPNPGDVAALRRKIKAACPSSAVSKQKKGGKKYTLVIYQRDLSRKLLFQDNVLAMLNNTLEPRLWDVKVVMHLPDRSPCVLSHILQEATVLLTPHGFQSMLLLFLPPKAILFEVFPYKYYKPAYAPFGRELGVVHGGVMSPPTKAWLGWALQFVTTQLCIQVKTCRVYARDQDVMLTAHGVRRLRGLIEEELGSAVLLPLPSFSNQTAVQMKNVQFAKNNIRKTSSSSAEKG